MSHALAYIERLVQSGKLSDEAAEEYRAVVRASGVNTTPAAHAIQPPPAEPATPYRVPSVQTTELALAARGLRRDGLTAEQALNEVAGQNLDAFRSIIEREREAEQKQLAKQARLAYEATPEGRLAKAKSIAAERNQRETLAEQGKLLLEAEGLPAEGLSTDELIRYSGLEAQQDARPAADDLAANLAAMDGDE